MQGNCGPKVPANLLETLPMLTEGRVEYPPLEPLQCAIVMDKPFLWNNNCTLWIDKIYFAMARTKVESDFSILQYGNDRRPEGVPSNSLYVTNSSFVGEGRGSARAIATFEHSTSVMVEGTCLFISFVFRVLKLIIAFVILMQTHCAFELHSL